MKIEIKYSAYMFCFINLSSKQLYLPPDIIALIYSFVLRDYYGKIINKFYFNRIKINKSINHIIQNNTFQNIEYIIESDYIEALQFLVKAHIPRKYDLNFWANYLHLLSKNINSLRFHHRWNNISLKTYDGKQLKLVLNLWLELCKKFNLKLFLQTKNSELYIRAKHVKKMNVYDKYIITPIIIQPFTDNQWINIDSARDFLESF